MPFATLTLRDLTITVLAWLAISAVLVGLYFDFGGSQMLVQEGDDAMRLVMVQDLLHGQPWQNQGVPRDNTPFGGQMHWSALVSLPIAGFTALLSAKIAIVVWPLLLLLPLMLLTLAASRRLAPTAGPGVVSALTAFNVVVISEFSPGRIDHHNVQMLLMQAVLAVTLFARQKLWGGALAGVLLASCLAVGIETLPIVLGVGVAYALCWLIDPVGNRAGLLGFATGLAGGMIGHLLFSSPLPQLFTSYCDANSIVYVTAACLSGAALAVAVLTTSGRPFWIRFGVLCVLAAMAAFVTAKLFPVCLAGPYANVDPRMLAEVFPQIPEVKSFWERIQESPLSAIPFGAAALAALAVAVWQAVRRSGDARIDWLVIVCMLGTACVVMLMQIRGARLAAALALPVAAWAIASLRQRLHDRPGVVAAGLLAGSWLVFASWAQAFLFTATELVLSPPASGEAAQIEPTLAQCLAAETFAKLAALPAGRVAAPYLLGPFILLNTPHSVLSAGYHRNGPSIIDDLDFFSGDEARARQIAMERGLNYVATCQAAAPDAHVGPAPGKLWPWLVRLSDPTDILQLYRIDAAAR